MRTIRRSSRFRRDFKRESRGQHRAVLASDFLEAIRLLAKDQALPSRLFDHALTGGWNGYRDCHIRPDLILIYRKSGTEELELARLDPIANLLSEHQE